MAARGTNKRKSQDQERYVARVYDARVSPSSGAAETDPGDVRTRQSLIECKTRGGPGNPKPKQRPSYNQVMGWLEQAAQEAWECGLDPVLAMRVYEPTSPLTNADGWVDLAIRPLLDDAAHDAVHAGP